MRSIPGCTEPKTYGEARSQLADALKMLTEANSLLLWWRYGKSMTLKQCAHLNDKTDIALGRFGLSEADIDAALSASAQPSATVELDERAEFERTFPDLDHNLCSHEDWQDQYECPKAGDMWNGWQARAALERKP